MRDQNSANLVKCKLCKSWVSKSAVDKNKVCDLCRKKCKECLKSPNNICDKHAEEWFRKERNKNG